MNNLSREIAVSTLEDIHEMAGQDYVEQQRALSCALELQEASFDSLVKADDDAKDNYEIVKAFADVLPKIEAHPAGQRFHRYETKSHIYARSELAAQMVLGSTIWREYKQNYFFQASFSKYILPYYVIGRQAAGALLFSPQDVSGVHGAILFEDLRLLRTGSSPKLAEQLTLLDQSRHSELTEQESRHLFDPEKRAYVIHPHGNARLAGTLSSRALDIQPSLPGRLSAHEMRSYNVIHNLNLMAQLTDTVPELQRIIRGTEADGS